RLQRGLPLTLPRLLFPHRGAAGPFQPQHLVVPNVRWNLVVPPHHLPRPRFEWLHPGRGVVRSRLVPDPEGYPPVVHDRKEGIAQVQPIPTEHGPGAEPFHGTESTLNLIDKGRFIRTSLLPAGRFLPHNRPNSHILKWLRLA